jgi:hypothetical protein
MALGRKSGTRNKDKQTVRDQMDKLDVNPIEALVRIAGKAEEVEEYQVAVKCYSERCNYAFPKLRAITVAGDQEQPVIFNINKSLPLPDSPRILEGSEDGAESP